MDTRSFFFENRVGIFQCRKQGCLTCQFITHGQPSFSDRTGNTYSIRQFITCSTQFAVYVLQCPCNLLYVGHTIRVLCTRVGEHHRFFEKGVDKHSVLVTSLPTIGRTLRSVLAIKYIPKAGLTENERFLRLCRKETLWI